MSAFEYPVLDGVAPSWADIEVRIAQPGGGVLIEMGDIVSISSGCTVEVGRQKEGGRTIKRTAGDSSEEANIVLYLSGYQKLLRGLKAAAPKRGNQRRLSLVSFNILQIWTPFGTSEIFERRIKGCRILGNASDNSEGTDAARIEIPLDPMQVVDVIDGEECVLL
jgi:hypothetical protein